MPVVANTEKNPIGTPHAGAQVRIRLVAALVGAAPGYVPASDYSIIGEYSTRTDGSGNWSVTLVANSLISPANTYYIADVSPKQGAAIRHQFVVPNTAGPFRVEDILSVPPANLPDLHQLDPIDAHAASAVSLAAVAGLVGDDVQEAVVNLVALDALKIPLTQRAAANGVATLDGTTKIPVAQVPDLSGTYVDKTTAQTIGGTKTFTSPIRAKAGPTYDVEAFGAVGDGVTDSTAAFVAARTAAPPGATIAIGDGTFVVDQTALYLYKSDTLYRGNRGRTVILGKVGGPLTAFCQPIALVSNVAFEDIIFDGNGVAGAGLSFQGGNAQGIRVSGCEFYRCGSHSVFLENVQGAVVEDCIFNDEGAPFTNGVYASGSCRNIVIRRNQFLWLKNGVSILGVAGQVSENIEVSDNYFDQGWWLLRHKTANSGGTVTFTASTLTDTAATFLALSPAVNDIVRVLPVRSTGTSTTIDLVSLTDTAAGFVVAGVAKGDIVRSGASFAVVAAVESATKIRVEAWWDDVKRAPLIPALGTYTVYRPILGRITGATNTELTIQHFHDLNGLNLTPAAGTRYELLHTTGIYGGVHTESGCRNSLFTRNIFRRSWGDQLSVFGGDNVLSLNVIEDGQDEGITSGGPRNTILGNVIARQGTSCIYASGQAIVVGNSCSDGQTQNYFDLDGTGVIHLAGDDNLATGNIISRNASVVAYGIVAAGARNRITGNIAKGAFTAAYRTAASASATYIFGNDGSVSDAGTTTERGVDSFRSVPAGTVAAPPLAFAADTDTGLWQAYAGRMDFVVNGVNRMTIEGTAMEMGLTMRPAVDATNDFGTSVRRWVHGFFTGSVGQWGHLPAASQPAAIANADGTLADITAKFNTLLAVERGDGRIAT